MSRRLLLALTAALALGAAGCASSGSGTGASSPSSSSAASPATASSAAALCDTASDLRTSIAALQQVDVVHQGVDAAQQAFDQVTTDISAVAGAAGAQFKPQLAQVQADRAAVQAAVVTAKATPTTQTLGALGAAVQKLVQDVQTLLTSIGSTC